jgi:hypothetical protein
MFGVMADVLKLIWWTVVGLFRSRASLEAEILTLRQQLNVLRRKAPKRIAFNNFDRLIFSSLYRIAPDIVYALPIVEPETIVRWHRAGFRLFWRWKSCSRAGRPQGSARNSAIDPRDELGQSSLGAPRIYGELFKLCIDIGQTPVAKYMSERRRPPSQGWRTFVHNHANGIASIDLFVVPTISFQLLHGLLIRWHDRRLIVCLSVTRRQTAEWMARQLTEAFGWEPASKYLIRDRDNVYGEIFKRRVRAMGIRDRATSFRSPWQNGGIRTRSTGTSYREKHSAPRRRLRNA